MLLWNVGIQNTGAATPWTPKNPTHCVLQSGLVWPVQSPRSRHAAPGQHFPHHLPKTTKWVCNKRLHARLRGATPGAFTRLTAAEPAMLWLRCPPSSSSSFTATGGLAGPGRCGARRRCAPCCSPPPRSAASSTLRACTWMQHALTRAPRLLVQGA